jgi:hypothetical protein
MMAELMLHVAADRARSANHHGPWRRDLALTVQP